MVLDLTNDNFILFAAKAYSKPFAIQEEFEEDLQRILYIKRLLTKYHSTGILRHHLIMNHLIIMSNVFTINAYVRILFLKLEEKDLPVIKPFLLYLNHLPPIVEKVNGKTYFTDEIIMDQKIVDVLRNT